MMDNHVSPQQTRKTAVLLIQLGTPRSPGLLDVARYLREFLSDPRVIDIPYWARLLLVNGIIVPFRSYKSSQLYKQLWKLSGGASPLLTNTLGLERILQAKFNPQEVLIKTAMRYQNPSIGSALEEIKRFNPEHIVIIPLFPQYASATSGSAIESALQRIAKGWVIPKISVVSQFYEEAGFIESVIAQTKDIELSEFDHILFSYHGLPQRHLDKTYAKEGCSNGTCHQVMPSFGKFCYKACCYHTSRLLAERLGISADKYTVCFQSRLNNKWIKPFADQVVVDLAQKGAKNILVFSPSFVSDCLETTLEIGEEYLALFKQSGGISLQLVPSTNTSPEFINFLENMILARL
jgi:ferrochelatase